MYRFSEPVSDPPDSQAQRPAPLLPLTSILKLVEKRLRWYGFGDWEIRDVICNTDPTVTVLVREPGGAVLALTIARDGGASHAMLVPAPVPRVTPAAAPARAAVVPHLARSLTTRAISAISSYGASCRFLNQPAACET